VKRSGGTTTAGLMDAPGGPITDDDETTILAIAGSPGHVHVVVAGGPAGGFVYALLPYGAGFAMREIQRPDA